MGTFYVIIWKGVKYEGIYLTWYPYLTLNSKEVANNALQVLFIEIKLNQPL